MKKLFFILALFASSLNGMDDNDRLLQDYIRYYQIYLHEYNNKTREKHPWQELKPSLEKLENVSAQNITNAVVVSINRHHFIDLAYNLMLFWQDKIDFKIPCSILTFAEYPHYKLIFHTIIDNYLHNNRYKKYETEESKQLYDMTTKTFFNKIDITLTEQPSGLTPFGIILKHFIGEYGDVARQYYLEIFLADFLDHFHHQLNHATIEEALDMCNIRPIYDFRRENKSICRMIIESYYPKKLCFIKEKLKNLHNCHFRYV